MARERSLRIIAGVHGGRRLRSPDPADDVRPTTERVREAVFSMLGPIEGRVLDLYCGSGAYGLEALSRGAEEASFVDLHTDVVAANVAELGFEDLARIDRSDALGWLPSADLAQSSRFDVVFCDPPYRLADPIAGDLQNLLPPRLNPGARVVCESASGAPIELPLELLRERAYGKSMVRIYRAPEAGS